MRYSYNVVDKIFDNDKSRSITASQLASIIKRDVEVGKWNTYNGGIEEKSHASCSYSAGNFTYHEKLWITGSEEEFKELEKLISAFIKVKPRTFK